jgi:hypothetical protein
MARTSVAKCDSVGLVEQPGDDRIPLGQDPRRRRLGHLTGRLVRHVVTFFVPIGSPLPELRRVTSDGYLRLICTSGGLAGDPRDHVEVVVVVEQRQADPHQDRVGDQLPTVKLVVSSAVESPPAKTSIVVVSITHALVAAFQ